MAKIHDLLERVGDANLRSALKDEFERATKHKKFGLVFEQHLPEAVSLYGFPIKVGSRVATKVQDGGALFIVKEIKGKKAECIPMHGGEAITFNLDELVAVALCGEPVFPILTAIDEVQNAPDSSLWHTLIQADNYHALQLLEYLYPGKVDCIYIDPPYNTGARDWKYNNDYVDGNDAYRHSKWLSMMQKRLRLAKKLLNPKNSVLIVTIDEKEYLHLGMLLEEIFPEARIQMVATQITPQGNPRVQQFYRTDEYIFFVGFGAAQPVALPLDDAWRTGLGETPKKNINWVSLLRTGSERRREDRPPMFYPIFIKDTNEGPIIDSIGDSYFGNNIDEVIPPEGTIAVWPVGRNGEYRRWQVAPTSARRLKKEGFLRLGRWNGSDTAVQYLAESNREGIHSGEIPVSGKRYDGSYAVEESYVPSFVPGTIWKLPSHDATRSGAQLLSRILGNGVFSFPKSLYAVHDTLRFFVANKPNAIIVDFFAGSGTTLHAVNLLNAEDGGRRRCIMVTNNEVSNDEATAFRAKGLKPGDEKWEKHGIAQYVTWPRTKCSILGENVKGEKLEGNYGVEVDDYVVDEEDVVVSKTTGKPTKTKIYKKTTRQMYPKLAEIAMADGFEALRCKIVGLGWLPLCASMKMEEVAGKREMRVQLKLVDPESEEAKAYDFGEAGS